MGDFLDVDGEEIIAICFKSREVSLLFSTESVMTARAAKAAAEGLMLEVAIADRGELGRNFEGENRDLWGSLVFVALCVLVTTFVS